MGRSYREELSELGATQAGVAPSVPALLAEQAAKAADAGLVVVASGGAKVVAEWASRLHRMAFGTPAVAMTPLEYAALASPVRAVTWLISAGGKHPDIHQAARAAQARGDACVVGIIGQSATPLEAWLKAELRGHVVDLGLPAGSDGFLATNSVWAMACALAKAYSRWLPATSELNDLLCDKLVAWGARAANEARADEISGRDLIVLYDAWTALGAQDVEARFIETALSNLWSTDFRNFGHGRHFWVADRSDRTALFALWTPSADELVEPTLSVLPGDLPILRVPVPYDGIVGALASLAWSIHLTAEWAQRRGRDPGRPGVPRFGEQLYEGGFPYPRTAEIDTVNWAIFRKSPSASAGGEYAATWRHAYEAARTRLDTTSVAAIVMDYDGTMVDSAKRYGPLGETIALELVRLLQADVCIGVATGRGDSVQKTLRAAIPETLWPRVVVGYHNGAAVLRLDEPVPNLDGPPLDPIFLRACEVLQQEVEGRGLGVLRCRENQLTVTPAGGQSLSEAWRAARECLDRNGFASIRIWLSSHSVDILAPGCSKLHVVNKVASLAGCAPNEVLRIGDRGGWPGNDWELLSAPLGISVDQCSSDMNTCWNLVPPQARGAAGTTYVLQRLQSDATGKVKFIDGVKSQ